MINRFLYYPFALFLVFLHTAGYAQQIGFDDQIQIYPGSAASCVVGKTLQRNENTWISISKCSDSRIAVTQYSPSNNQDTLITDSEFGLDGVVTFDSITGITTHPEFSEAPIEMLSRDLKFTDARLNLKGELLIAGFNYDLVESDDAPLLYTNVQPWWLMLDSRGIPVLSTSNQYLHWQPNPFESFSNFGGGDWFHGLRSNAFVLPTQDGSVITGSVLNSVLDRALDDVLSSANPSPYGNIIRLQKYLSNGQPDTEFAQSGTLEIIPAATDRLFNYAYIAGIIDYDDSHFLLITGDFFNHQYGGFGLMKVSYDGIVQTEFANNARFTTPGLLETSQFTETGINGVARASVSDLVIYENWIYLSWQEQDNHNPDKLMNVLTRLNADGNLDTTFADEGMFKWPSSFGENSNGPGQFKAGNPYISVLDGQIALLNSDVRVSTDQESSISTTLQLLTHNGQLNQNFANNGVLIETSKGITDAFSFSGNAAFSPPLNMNKAMHLFAQKRQLVIPTSDQSSRISETTLSVMGIFVNEQPKQVSSSLLFTVLENGRQIDTRIMDPDDDELHIVIIDAPDYVSLDGLSSNNSVQIFAEVTDAEPTSFDVTLSVSDGINSPYIITLSVSIPSKMQLSADDTVSGGAIGYWLAILCIVTYIRRRIYS